MRRVVRAVVELWAASVIDIMRVGGECGWLREVEGEKKGYTHKDGKNPRSRVALLCGGDVLRP